MDADTSPSPAGKRKKKRNHAQAQLGASPVVTTEDVPPPVVEDEGEQVHLYMGGDGTKKKCRGKRGKGKDDTVEGNDNDAAPTEGRENFEDAPFCPTDAPAEQLPAATTQLNASNNDHASNDGTGEEKIQVAHSACSDNGFLFVPNPFTPSAAENGPPTDVEGQGSHIVQFSEAPVSGDTSTRSAQENNVDEAQSDRLMRRSLCRSTIVATPEEFEQAFWKDVLVRYGGVNEEMAMTYAKMFIEHGLPFPSPDASVYLTHAFLQEVGVKRAGDRAKVMLACHRMPALNHTPAAPLDKIDAPGSQPQTGEPPEGSEAAQNASFFNMTRGSPEKRGELEKKMTQKDLLISDFAELGHHVEAGSSYERDTTTVKSRKFTSNDGKFTWIDLKGKDTLDIVAMSTPLITLRQNPRTVFDNKLLELFDEIDEDFSPEGTLFSILDTILPLPQLQVDRLMPSRCSFVMRVCTLDVSEDDDTIRDLTNRWTIFVDAAQHRVVTIHRVDSIALASLRDNWEDTFKYLNFKQFLVKIMERYLMEFDKALTANDEWLDWCEAGMLSSQHRDGILRSLFHLQRRASVYDRMIILTKTLIHREVSKHLYMEADLEPLLPRFQQLQEQTVNLKSRSQGLLEIHLSLVGYRTNELMKVLTKVSMFFTPLTFIAGVYGMNYTNMPELEFEYGYYICLGVMAIIGFLVFFFMQVRKIAG